VLLGDRSAASMYAECRSLAALLGGAPVELLWSVEDVGGGRALLSVAFNSALPPGAGYFAFGIPQDGGMVGGSALIFSVDPASPSGAHSVLKASLSVCKGSGRAHSMYMCEFCSVALLALTRVWRGAQARPQATRSWRASAWATSLRGRARWTSPARPRPCSTARRPASRRASHAAPSARLHMLSKIAAWEWQPRAPRQGAFGLVIERLVQSLASLAAPLDVMYALGPLAASGEPMAHGATRALDRLDLEGAFQASSSTAPLDVGAAAPPTGGSPPASAAAAAPARAPVGGAAAALAAAPAAAPAAWPPPAAMRLPAQVVPAVLPGTVPYPRAAASARPAPADAAAELLAAAGPDGAGAPHSGRALFAWLLLLPAAALCSLACVVALRWRRAQAFQRLDDQAVGLDVLPGSAKAQTRAQLSLVKATRELPTYASP
jgi:hypothetical protein